MCFYIFVSLDELCTVSLNIFRVNLTLFKEHVGEKGFKTVCFWTEKCLLATTGVRCGDCKVQHVAKIYLL